jgi:hypothetical protein
VTDPDTRATRIELLLEDARKLTAEFVDELERRSPAGHHASWLAVRLAQAAQCAKELKGAL